MEQYRLDLENELKKSPITDSSVDLMIPPVIARQNKQATIAYRMKRFRIGLIAVSIIGLLAFGIWMSALSDYTAANTEVGDFIIDKENGENRQEILVASHVSGKDIKKSVAELRTEKVSLMWYHIEDTKLYEDLAVGEKVTVKPKTFMYNGKELTTVLTSDPPHAAAGVVIRYSKKERTQPVLHREISADEVAKVTMGKWVYGETRVEHVDVELSQQEIDQFRTWFNSVPVDRVKQVQYVNSNLSAGIVFDLKSNVEVRIQYDKKDIYVTRTDPKQDATVYYIVEYPELKSFFDEKLK